MSFRGKRRSVNTRPVRKAGVMTASRWSATNPAHSVRREVRSDDSRLDESSAGCPSTSCSPAELASVSPAVAILLNLKQAVQRKTAVRPAASRLVSHARGQAQRALDRLGQPGAVTVQTTLAKLGALRTKAAFSKTGQTTNATQSTMHILHALFFGEGVLWYSHPDLADRIAALNELTPCHN